MMIRKKLLPILSTLAVSAAIGAFSFSGCAWFDKPDLKDGEKQEEELGDPELPPDSGEIRIKTVIQGYEWGPAIPKLIVRFSDDVSEISAETFSVSHRSGAITAQAQQRNVVNAYNCDWKGNPTDNASSYIAIEMSVKYNEASPFTYDNNMGRNDWTNVLIYSLTVNKGQSVIVGDKEYEGGDVLSYSIGAKDRWIPQTENWKKEQVRYTDEGKDITLTRASWAPKGADKDKGKNPLIIWLHGAGEGGTDIDIALLGNEVTALTVENETNVQYYFQDSGCAGAYVLAVQTPTMWMDLDGTGKYNNMGSGKQESYYTEALWQAITTYVESNPDIDTDRIYLGGCSNGGYMTMNMMFEHGDYFAAYYPICQAYANARISDSMLSQIKDYKIWFVLSADDTTVSPAQHTLPLFNRLIQAGAADAHLTLFDHVRGIDDPTPAASWGTPANCYMGHWSWICLFNDAVGKKFDNKKVTGVNYLTAANCKTDGNLWEWLADQSK